MSGRQLEHTPHINPQYLFVELCALTLCTRNNELQVSACMYFNALSQLRS